MNKRIAYMGNMETGEHIIKSLEEQGGINQMNLLGRDEECMYYVDNSSLIRRICKYEFDLTLLENIFEIK